MTMAMWCLFLAPQNRVDRALIFGFTAGRDVLLLSVSKAKNKNEMRPQVARMMLFIVCCFLWLASNEARYIAQS